MRHIERLTGHVLHAWVCEKHTSEPKAGNYNWVRH